MENIKFRGSCGGTVGLATRPQTVLFGTVWGPPGKNVANGLVPVREAVPESTFRNLRFRFAFGTTWRLMPAGEEPCSSAMHAFLPRLRAWICSGILCRRLAANGSSPMWPADHRPSARNSPKRSPSCGPVTRSRSGSWIGSDDL